MEFQGHTLYKIEKGWAFDLTTFIGYKVTLDDKGNVTDYTSAFSVRYTPEMRTYSFDKIIDVPTQVLRKTVNIIQNYREEALLENASW